MGIKGKLWGSLGDTVTTLQVRFSFVGSILCASPFVADESYAWRVVQEHDAICERICGTTVAVDLSIWLHQAMTQPATAGIFQPRAMALKVTFDRVWLAGQPAAKHADIDHQQHSCIQK